MIPKFRLPESLVNLYVSVPDFPSLCQLQKYLFNRSQPLKVLVVRVSPCLDLKGIGPLPGNITSGLHLYISDVSTKDEGVKGAANIAKRFLPTSGGKSFTTIEFPRCSLKEDGEGDGENGLSKLLQELKGVRISGWISFPDSCKPSSDEQEEDLQRIAKEDTQCSLGIIWKKNSDWVGSY